MTDISIIPLALTVMLGPQILVGMLLITRQDAIRSSLIYSVAVASTLMLTTFIYYAIATYTGIHKIEIGNKPILKYFLVLLFVFLIIRSILNRNNITEPPKWMKSIKTASLSRIFILGFSLIAFMPTDIIVSFSVGSLLTNSESPYLDFLPFFSAVLLITFSPMLLYFLLGKNRTNYLKKVNKWLNTNGYMINVIVLVYFITLLVN